MGTKLGILGATGAVGQELLSLLEDSDCKFDRVRLFASQRSLGKGFIFRGKTLPCEQLSVEILKDLDLLFCSAGSSLVKEWAPQALEQGCTVVDNSSAFRQDPEVPLVIPEINGALLDAKPKLVAVPNCSIIMTLMALYPLHQIFELDEVIAATYQSVSGAGARAMADLESALKAHHEGQSADYQFFPEPMAFNVLPKISHRGDPEADGYTDEESKMMSESCKILDQPDLKLTATCVRVPVMRAHAAALHVVFKQDVNADAIAEAYQQAAGVTYHNELKGEPLVQPLLAAHKDEVLVGRLRLCRHNPKAIDLFCAMDQLRKGAALNALQIAQRLQLI